MTKLILVRHAEALGNISRRFQGHIDADITENGEKQIECLKKRFEAIPLDIIYTSDLLRTQKTARAVRGDRDIEIRIEPGLREINGGDWEDVTWEELPIRWAEDYDNWCHHPERHQMPNGETMKEVEDRMVKNIDRIVQENKGKTICVTSHGTALKIYVAAKKGWGLKRLNEVGWYDNTAVTMVDIDDDGAFDFIIEGDISHLPDELSTLKKQVWWKDTV